MNGRAKVTVLRVGHLVTISICCRRPKEHLMSVLVQNPQAVGVLRQVQSVEERFCFYLCALQIRCDVRNPIEYSVCVVLFSNAEKLNNEHHLVASLSATNRVYARNSQCQWLLATAEHHTHIYSAAEFHADHHSVSSSINHSKG